MAEIKSTLEKVMERVASMGEASRSEIDAEEKVKEGMRLAAEYLRGQAKALMPALTREPEKGKSYLRLGIVRALLRNITLPRDEDQPEAQQRALNGLYELGAKRRNVIDILSDVKQVLDRYQKHKKQLHQQLEDTMRRQLEQAMVRQGLQATGGVKINAALHPKFREEWQRIKAELNDQYGQALEQQKEFLTELLGG